MVKVGDTVRYLNAVGGGIVTRIEGKVAYVDEDGFETPVLVNEIVTVLPAGHEKKAGAPNLFFDQNAFDAAKNRADNSKSQQTGSKATQPLGKPEPPQPETTYGNKLNIALAFEPTNIRELSKSDFNAVLVNDSNYWLYFTFLRRSAEDRGWHTVTSGEVAPNELLDVAVLSQGGLNDYERVALQYVAFKKEKTFEMKAPCSISRKLDLTKFFKLHSFRPGIYFENPVMEIRLVKDDVSESADITEGVKVSSDRKSEEKPNKKNNRGKELNPHKLLPLIEVDLHINELLDNTSGMEAKDMLQYQLDTVRKTMKENALRKGQKIVFVHGKGDGVLRKAVRDLLKKEYPHSDLQDASFQEYGFGATLVTIHN